MRVIVTGILLFLQTVTSLRTEPLQVDTGASSLRASVDSANPSVSAVAGKISTAAETNASYQGWFSESEVVTPVIVVTAVVLGIAWSIFEIIRLKNIVIDGHPNIMSEGVSGSIDATNKRKTLAMMTEVSQHIADGAQAFLMEEYKYLTVFIVIFSIIIGTCVSWQSMVAYILGAITSCACGYIGMRTAVMCNVRTCHECWLELSRGYSVALRGGSVMGLTLVSLAVGVLYLLVLFFTNAWKPESKEGVITTVALFEAVAGYGLGGSTIALFARVGGGIYTKAADVGADLSGKNEYGMEEDDPRNPACIADNVGDNVGDIAGMGADLFGSFAESTCAAFVLLAHSVSFTGKPLSSAFMFPLLVIACGIFVSFFTLVAVPAVYPVKEEVQIERALKLVLIVSTVLMTPIVFLLAFFCLPAAPITDLGGAGLTHWWSCAVSVLMGLWSGLVIGVVTEYFTSHSYGPVRQIADSQRTSAATGIIFGLALGYFSCIVPVLCLAATILASHSAAGFYGIALAAIGMLSTLPVGLTIDAYGPISDNAGGIAEMANVGEETRRRTDALDAAGNTTAAIGKGFAIGSAALVSLALFSAFCKSADIVAVDVLESWTFVGLIIGALLPFAFSAMTLRSVGFAAEDMVKECMRQFPLIVSGQAEPDYARCIAISTRASIWQMVPPGLLVILSPLVMGMCFGKNATAGLLAGSLVAGVMLAISMSNTGGAWDNSKKYIEAGNLGEGNLKGSATHKNAVTGDTVGDPLKDTSGPSLNILVKLSAITALMFAGVIDEHFSADNGGPKWFK